MSEDSWYSFARAVDDTFSNTFVVLERFIDSEVRAVVWGMAEAAVYRHYHLGPYVPWTVAFLILSWEGADLDLELEEDLYDFPTYSISTNAIRHSLGFSGGGGKGVGDLSSDRRNYCLHVYSRKNSWVLYLHGRKMTPTFTWCVPHPFLVYEPSNIPPFDW